MTRSGLVAISGQPNVGKSTILNGLLKEKVAIISKRPETTRDIIRGILTEKDCQIVFIDTPGIHKPHDLLGKLMLSRAQSSLMEADIVLFITEKNLAFNREDENILERLPRPEEGKKVIFIINKADKVKDKKLLLPIMDKAQKIYPFNEIIPLCALHQPDLDRLLEAIKKYLPEGPFLYPEDQLTDKGEDFAIKEMIREKILSCTFEEVPHSVAVVIDDMEEKEDIVRIYATIYVERISQKSIIIGKTGSMIKKIGEMARPEIEELLSKHVHLDLWVKVYDKWKKDPKGLRELGYTD
jgi:GTP-binding protein Era